MFQSQQLGLTGQWKAVVKAYIDANLLVRLFLSPLPPPHLILTLVYYY